MNATKEKLLNDTYQKFIDVSSGLIESDEILYDIVDKNLLGFGTTIDEKMFSIADYRTMLLAQKEQSKDLQMHFNVTPLKRVITPTENTAVITGEITISVKAENETIEIYLRFSVVLEYRQDKWIVIHFHASKPELVESEADTFGIEEWKQKNAELERKVAEKTSELRQSLENLKATQSQLIQAEKMASLGELTAGIAHEIQNPLNFVNNFSELNQELVEELDEELNKGDIEEAKAIAKDIKDNESKINHHGKRADAIVKGMLQHSRKSTAQKEPTDINKLADEYLRLAYHGLRAKDKSFNATLETDFDETIGKVNVIPQDMGRVILNLITNAFYACNERKKVPLAPEGGTKYEPKVSISTRKPPPSGGRGNSITISVKDNGIGIPKHVVDKIFQPFFTTKPSGEGTGLGLSMSYDIVKAHGGTLKVESILEKGTTFTFNLPKK